MLNAMLSRFIEIGRLEVTEEGQSPRVYGDRTGPAVAVWIAKPWAWRIALNP